MNPLFSSSSETVLIISFSITIFVLVGIVVFRLGLTKAVKNIAGRLDQLDKELSDYRSFNKYLRGKMRLDIEKSLKYMADSTSHALIFRPLLSKKEKQSVLSSKKRIESLNSFLEYYVRDYVKLITARHADFFAKASLDPQQQLEPVVKDDAYNLVVAAAGSGKTSVLTARLAFLVERGISPDNILALAYTRTAAREMQERLSKKYGISALNIRTFHSFGRELAKDSPNFRNDVAGDNDQHEIIRKSLRQLSSNHDFALSMLQFAIEYPNDDLEADSFPDKQKSCEYLRNQRYTTLTSERVDSVAERDIANFLFLNQVQFKHADPATWADSSIYYRTYRPDFHLSKYDIWIEHRGVDRQEKVPEWFAYGEVDKSEDPSERYQKRMEWSRGQFAKHKHTLIETFHYEWTEGTLIHDLKKTLEEHGVVLTELSTNEVVSNVYNLLPRNDPLEILTFSFISTAKSNGLGIGEIRQKAETRKLNRRQKAFLSFVVPVWQEYESRLKSNNMIDFNDMIGLALEVARKHRKDLERKYTHVLIDEFQDITDTQLELIKCIVGGEDSHLFCVGDDWQNIFSFAGSNVYNILHFDKNFAFPEKSFIGTNYRCPKNVVEASNHVISLNRFQMRKDVTSKSKLSYPIVVEEMPENMASREYDKWELKSREGSDRALTPEEKYWRENPGSFQIQ